MLCRLNAINLDITNTNNTPTNYDSSNEPEFPSRWRETED
jgi:hypothetical protein